MVDTVLSIAHVAAGLLSSGRGRLGEQASDVPQQVVEQPQPEPTVVVIVSPQQDAAQPLHEGPAAPLREGRIQGCQGYLTRRTKILKRCIALRYMIIY